MVRHNLNQPKGLSFKSNSAVTMCFHIETSLSGLYVLHLIEKNILRRMFDHGC